VAVSPIRRALVSVSDKSNLPVLARALIDHKIEVLSTGGTAHALVELGVAVVKVGEHTGMPEILGGRVKTLHPKIHGGILALPTPEHEAELEQHDIAPIDLVVVNLYPFQKVTADPTTSFETAVENIDIGGPTMIRAAAKNWTRVLAVVDPSDYGELAQTLAAHGGGIPDAFRRRLARKVFLHTATYDAAIAQYLARHDDEGRPHLMPAVAKIVFVGGQASQASEGMVGGDLRYGENPHQAAGFVQWSDPDETRLGLDRAIVHQGKALSYNNLLDADAALDLVRDLQPLGAAAVVFKHATPCGAAVARRGESELEAVYVRARQADAESAFGGIVAVSQVVDEATARRLVETFLEVILAPGYTAEALPILATKVNLRVLELPRMFATAGSVAPVRLRSIAGGLLVQQEDRIGVTAARANVVTKRTPTDDERTDLDVAWRVAKHVRSNAIVVVRDGTTVGIGGGQTSRVEAVRQAFARAGERSNGAVLASDGFFPFADSVELAGRAGIVALIQPGGSKRDDEVVAMADQLGLAMLLTGERHFRH